MKLCLNEYCYTIVRRVIVNLIGNYSGKYKSDLGHHTAAQHKRILKRVGPDLDPELEPGTAEDPRHGDESLIFSSE